MYVRSTRTCYDRSGQQVARRGPFLLLLQLKDRPCCADNTYACVRRVALGQLGHFMMGRANIAGKWLTVSGSYGSDGLPMGVETLPKDAVRLPAYLYQAWSKGEGWNDAGREAPAMAEWARDQFKV